MPSRTDLAVGDWLACEPFFGFAYVANINEHDNAVDMRLLQFVPTFTTRYESWNLAHTKAGLSLSRLVYRQVTDPAAIGLLSSLYETMRSGVVAAFRHLQPVQGSELDLGSPASPLAAGEQLMRIPAGHVVAVRALLLNKPFFDEGSRGPTDVA